MQCPSCGYENVSGAERCASCGRPLPQTVGQGYGFPSSGEPSSMSPGGPYQPPTSTPQPPFTSPGSPYGEMPGQPNTSPPGYGMPAQPSGYGAPTPQAGYGAPTPPSGYGTPAPPSGYGAPPGYGAPTPQPGAPYAGYGQAAPPSYPMQPGQPGWQYPPGYGPGGQPPQRRGRTGLIVGIIITVVVVLVACSVGGLVLLSQAGNLTSTTIGEATATAAATATPSETVLFQSALTTSSPQMTQSEHCFFASGGYHVKDNFICPVDISERDVHIKVTAKQISGPTDSPYGVAFRESSSNGWYELDISSDGGWGVFKCPADATSCSQLVKPSDASALKQNLNTENVLEVRTQGTRFEFFVNGTRLGQADDSSLTSGKVALSCGPGMECVYTDLTISKAAA